MSKGFFRALGIVAICVCSVISPTGSATLSDDISVTATPIALYPDQPDRRDAGKLIYRGGLEISSTDSRFGGLSDMAVSADGNEILAVADVVLWFRARLLYDAEGTLNGIADAALAPIRGLSGNTMQKMEGDAEGLTLVEDHNLRGQALVSFEGNHRVWRYDLGQGFGALPTPVAMGHWINGLKSNEGLEGLALLSHGRLLALSEHTLDRNGDIVGGLESYPGTDASDRADTGTLTVAAHGLFSVTSAARADDGRVYILERSFTFPEGPGMELRRLNEADIRPGARLEGEVIARLSGSDANIDNMEGLAVRRDAKGRTFVYMIADDNFSPLQRTVLLMFELKN